MKTVELTNYGEEAKKKLKCSVFDFINKGVYISVKSCESTKVQAKAKRCW